MNYIACDMEGNCKACDVQESGTVENGTQHPTMHQACNQSDRKHVEETETLLSTLYDKD